MKQGNLMERILVRSVLKHICRENPECREGAAIGQDFSDVRELISADGWHAEPEIAYIKADNNFSCSGGKPQFVRLLTVLAGDTDEEYLNRVMMSFKTICSRDHVQIAGGHTTVEPSLHAPRFYVTVCGLPGTYRQRADRGSVRGMRL